MCTKRLQKVCLWLLLIASLSSSCSPRSTPPGANSIGGVVDAAYYSYHYWEEGLAILVWHDLSYAAESCSGTGSTEDPVYRLVCDVRARDGRHFRWEVHTSDGVTAEMWIDDKSFDLSQGAMFLVSTQNDGISIGQLQRDFSELEPDNEAISALTNGDRDVANFVNSVEGALHGDAAAFADAQGLTLDEAMQRMQFQETIGDIQPLLMANLPDIYGGLWIEQQPEYRIVVALAEGDIETIRPYLEGHEWADFVEVRPVTYTLEELHSDQAIASQATNSVQVSAITAVDIVNNRVELIVGNPGLFLTDLAQAGIELPESVVVLANDPEGELPDTNRGILLEAITSDDRAIYLPVQPPSGDSMAALMEGTLVEANGCLRIEDDHYADGWLVLWPFGSDIRVADDRIEVINEDGNTVARVGDRLRAGGGAVENACGVESINEKIPGMPIEGCPGPYWVAAPLETMVEQSIPDIYFEPFSSGGEIVTWFVNQSRPSPETESLGGELILDEASCLRLDEYLLILPPETYLREDPLRIVDRRLDEIARPGDIIQVTGAEKDTDDYRFFENKVHCPGPYWGVNQISAAE
jgi:hypothetical protein